MSLLAFCEKRADFHCSTPPYNSASATGSVRWRPPTSSRPSVSSSAAFYGHFERSMNPWLDAEMPSEATLNVADSSPLPSRTPEIQTKIAHFLSRFSLLKSSISDGSARPKLRASINFSTSSS